MVDNPGTPSRCNATLGAGPGPPPPEVQYFSGGRGLYRGQRRTCQQLKACHPAVAARPPSLYGTTTPPLRRRTYHCCHTVPERPKPGTVAERLSHRCHTVPLRLCTPAVAEQPRRGRNPASSLNDSPTVAVRSPCVSARLLSPNSERVAELLLLPSPYGLVAVPDR